MSDQVGNPEDRFSHNEAQMRNDMICCTISLFNSLEILIEPRYEDTLFYANVNNLGMDELVHPQSLISTLLFTTYIKI